MGTRDDDPILGSAVPDEHPHVTSGGLPEAFPYITSTDVASPDHEAVVQRFLEEWSENSSPARRATNSAQWPGYITRTIAGEIIHWRRDRNLSAKELSDRTADLGWRVPRAVITNLENDRRESVGVHELLILAAALDVAPIQLIAPVGRTELVDILPKLPTTPWTVRGWFHGAVSLKATSTSIQKWRSARRAIALYDQHRILTRRYQDARNQLTHLLSSPRSDTTANEHSSESVLRHAMANNFTAAMSAALTQLREHRRVIQDAGFLLPELPRDLHTVIQQADELARERFDPSSEFDPDDGRRDADSPPDEVTEGQDWFY